VFACRLKADQISLFTLGTHKFQQGLKTVQPSVTVTRQILPLDSQLDNSDVVDNFNLDYFDDDHIPLSGTIVTEALTALAKPEEILPLVFSSVCNWGISQSKLPSPTGISASLLGATKAS
jgi:hypothetical protein